MKVWIAAISIALVSVCLFAATASAQSDCQGDDCGGPPVECESECTPPTQCDGECPTPLPNPCDVRAVVCPPPPNCHLTETPGKAAVTPCQPFCPPPLPVTDPATGVTGQAATLNGHILSWSGDARYYFEYGTVPGVYPFSTPPKDSPVGDVHVSAPVAGLSPGTTYFFRLVVIGCGVTQFGEELSLGTVAAAADLAPAAGAEDQATGGAVTADSAPAVTATATATVATTAAVVRVQPARKAVKKAKKAKKHKKARKHRRHR